MIISRETLLYIATTAGKPVIAIFNDIENIWYFYLSDTFKPANPSNHIHDNELKGKNLSSLLTSIQGYAHGNNTTSSTALLTKLEELPLEHYTFNGFRWIKTEPF